MTKRTNKITLPKIERSAPAPLDDATAKLLHDVSIVGLPIPGLTPGRMVHWVKSEGEHRPAIVISIADGAAGLVNMLVFMDGANDGYAADSCAQWLEARQFDPMGAVNTWHFIERVE